MSVSSSTHSRPAIICSRVEMGFFSRGRGKSGSLHTLARVSMINLPGGKVAVTKIAPLSANISHFLSFLPLKDATLCWRLGQPLLGV